MDNLELESWKSWSLRLQKITCFSRYRGTLKKVFFALFAIVSQVGVNVLLPLWIDSTILKNKDANGTTVNQSTISFFDCLK